MNIKINALIVLECIFLCFSYPHGMEEETMPGRGLHHLKIMKTIYPPSDYETEEDLNPDANMDCEPDPYTIFLKHLSLRNMLMNTGIVPQITNIKDFEPKHQNSIDMNERHIRATNQEYDITNYIEQADEALMNDPEYQIILNKVFETEKPKVNTKELSKSSIQPYNNTLDRNADNNTGMDDRHLGPGRLSVLHDKFVPTTQKTHDKGVANENPNGVEQYHLHPGVDEHRSEMTEKQGDVFIGIFGAPPERPTQIKSSDALTTTTGAPMTTKSLPEENRSTTGNNAANAQTISYMCSMIFIVLFHQL